MDAFVVAAHLFVIFVVVIVVVVVEFVFAFY